MAMAASSSSLHLSPSHRRLPTPKSTASSINAAVVAQPPKTALAVPSTRRTFTFLLTTSTTIGSLLPLPSLAKDIPLFGLRKKLERVEKEAEEIVEKGIEAAEKGIEGVEKEIKGVEKEIEVVEKEIVESAVVFGSLAQAGAVGVAEVVAVIVASSVVNGILGPEGSRS